eukprot:TRINITY_DN64643_c0_g1_i1.p1 TRINITY_DN64643_c0_g1~~TRINITY_DN64643_c0_g1_i1.p1  ORF type:complete len:275 (+),score=81.40 TRINITY_DN64643_c0_g1_i1:77-901(+)
MAPTAPSSAERLMPSPAALEFLMLLGRVESAVRQECPEGSGEESEEDIKVWKAKVRCYEESLRERLKLWEDLPESTAERLRSRIEDITPALEKALDEKRKALAAPKVEATEAAAATSGAALDPGGVSSGLGTASSLEVPQPALIASAAAANVTPPVVEVSDLPWRKRGGAKPQSRKLPSASAAGLRSGIEDEMVDIAEGMKGAANIFLKTLKADNSKLDDMSDSQQKSLDKVTAETEKGKKLLRSSQLGFFCTMIMVAVSVVIFCMMIPFIIFT